MTERSSFESGRARGRGLEQSPDVAGEVALEAADRFAGALAFAASAVDVVARLGVAARAGDDDAVQRGVDLAVAARSRRRRWVLAELAGIGATPAARASLADVAKRWAPAISPTSLATVSGPKPGSFEQLRRDLPDELGDLTLKSVDGVGELAHAPQLIAGDPHAHRLLSPGQAAGDAGAPLL